MGQNQFVKFLFKFSEVLNVRGMPLQRKLIISTIMVLIIPVIVIFYFMFNSYINDKKDDQLKYIQLLDTQAMKNIDSYLTDIDQYTLQPLYDSNIITHSIGNEYLDILTILRESVTSGENTGKNIKGTAGSAKPDANGNILDDNEAVFKRSINRIMYLKKDINAVFITNMDGSFHQYKIKDNSLYESGYNPSKEEWFKLCKNNKAHSVILKSTKYKDTTRPMKQNSYVFPVARSIADLNTSEIVGVICIYTEVDLLRRVCREIKSSEEERLLIINGNGDILYDTEEKYISGSIKGKDFDLKFLNTSNLDDKGTTVNKGGNSFYISSVRSKVADWTLVRISPQKILYEKISKIQFNLLFIMITFVILSLLVSSIIVLRITKPLKKMISTMNVIEKGDLSVRFKVKYDDEIGRLGRNFNSMINKIDNLINSVYVSELKKREAELSALQAQINPHFIYNTLESIRMMAELNDDEPTSRMTLMLGKLMRYSISTKNQIVTIRQEMEHLKSYMILQNYRFSNKFDLVLEIPEELYEINIIKLVFQPIVENAIFHGLETVGNRGIIRIQGVHEEDCIIFNIKDNGAGMSGEQVEQLNQTTNDFTGANKGSRGIGLKNINERIKLHYGNEYGLQIFSELGKGTVVRLKLPGSEELNKLTLENGTLN